MAQCVLCQVYAVEHTILESYSEYADDRRDGDCASFSLRHITRKWYPKILRSSASKGGKRRLSTCSSEGARLPVQTSEDRSWCVDASSSPENYRCSRLHRALSCDGSRRRASAMNATKEHTSEKLAADKLAAEKRAAGMAGQDDKTRSTAG